MRCNAPDDIDAPAVEINDTESVDDKWFYENGDGDESRIDPFEYSITYLKEPEPTAEYDSELSGSLYETSR